MKENKETHTHTNTRMHARAHTHTHETKAHLGTLNSLEYHCL